MGDNIVEWRWKEMRENVKEWWSKLTDDDLDRIQGRRDRLVNALKASYGYAPAKAHAEIDRRIQEYEQKRSKLA